MCYSNNLSYNIITWYWNRAVVGILFGNPIALTNCCSCVLLGDFEALAECKNSNVEERDLLNILPKFKLCCDNLPSLHVTWKWVTILFMILHITYSFMASKVIHSLKECTEVNISIILSSRLFLGTHRQIIFLTLSCRLFLNMCRADT
jgi:hypothetical protein